MTILTLNKKELEKKVGKIDSKMEELITMMGTPIEEIKETEISVEVFPNRPDLLSLQNFARALNQYIGKEKVADFKINKPEKDFVVTIDKSVKKIRPYTVCAIVKNLNFDDEKIKEIVDIQEKLHNSIGRNRKKVAIGVYPLEKIKLPIKFIAKKPEEIKFVPLDSPKEMNGRQILRNHPTGRDYAHLLKNAEVFPIFVDSNNKILSMPPIINSEETGRITKNTKEIFIECSGHNLFYLKKCLNILISALYDMGGKIYSMEIKDSKEGNFISPDMSYEEKEFDIKNIEKTLGINLTEKDIRIYLEKMGIKYTKKKDKSFALIPPYRMDILHWIDLSEEVAIAYGYQNFKPEIPKISTIGEEDSFEKKKKVISNILVGLGILETSTFHLTTKKNIKKIHYEFNNFIEVEDSKTERNVLRIDLLTNQLQIFSENSDSLYPQKIFEIGRVFEKNEKSDTGTKENNHLAISIIDEEVRFTDLKQILDYLFKMIDKSYEIKETDNNNYIEGRVGEIIFNGKNIGYIGEIAPRVLKNWKIKTPVVSLEMNVDLLINQL